MHLGLKRKEEEEEEKKILDYRELCDFVDTALKTNPISRPYGPEIR